jgi:hypothetical protein
MLVNKHGVGQSPGQAAQEVNNWEQRASEDGKVECYATWHSYCAYIVMCDLEHCLL